MNDPLLRFAKKRLRRNASVDRHDLSASPRLKSLIAVAENHVGVNIELFTSKRCPPDVFIVQSKHGVALVRSERLDTLLAEYLTLKDSMIGEGNIGDHSGRIEHFISSWLLESTLSQGLVSFSLDILASRDTESEHYHNGVERGVEISELSGVRRLALQGAAICHEVGHLIQTDNSNLRLDFPHLGKSPIDHVEWDLINSGVPKPMIEKMLKVFSEKIDPAHLFEEIDADVFAFQSIAGFLNQSCGVDLRASIISALEALESVTFLQALKIDTVLVREIMRGRVNSDEFAATSWANGATMVARTRTVLRAAAFYWATLEGRSNGTEVSVEMIEARRMEIDALITPTFEFQGTLNGVYSEYYSRLGSSLIASNIEVQKSIADRLDDLELDQQMQYHIKCVLTRMGFGPEVEPIEYLRELCK